MTEDPDLSSESSPGVDVHMWHHPGRHVLLLTSYPLFEVLLEFCPCLLDHSLARAVPMDPVLPRKYLLAIPRATVAPYLQPWLYSI
jgi:hypothetical protein